ncbi:GGDEF domain-containing protein [Ramlibacter sp. G-1-2-2]|uniref:GGDEF domain-containing protein n=1 Tax=Ramlibacter agri TaxID=2728837 RepID=A0A848HFE8_9BURK|nr:GGDEF domain-containing protein [Ramlibacter agri]NML46338.1 GGDEF domain-containing protein [Ramlibacter agri]
MTDRLEAAPLWLGACVGAQLLVVVLCVVMAVAWRERPLLLHAAATLMSALALQALLAHWPVQPRAVLLLVLALAGLQLLDLVSHAGGLRTRRRWLLGASAVALPVLAALSTFSAWFAAGGVLLWLVVVLLVLQRAWLQSQPWAWWLAPGLLALLAAAGSTLLEQPLAGMAEALELAVLLTLWTGCIYIGTSWRGRLYGETRARIQARNTIDPLTGLATPLVLAERVQAARHLTKRYGHPSVLMIVHIENLPAIAHEFGPETAEAAVLAAASRVREALLRDGDVAARLAHARIGVLAEGAAPGQAAATVATRILSAGLKEPLAAAPAEYLRFRIALGPVPVDEIPPKLLLHRLNARLDAELQARNERRIATLSQDEMLVRTDFSTL